MTLTEGFYLGKYEITQAQYEAVMTGNPDGLSPTPSQFGGNEPPWEVSWEDAQVFLNRLNDLEQTAADCLRDGPMSFPPRLNGNTHVGREQ